MIKDQQQQTKTDIACYSLLLENIANREKTKMSRFKVFAAVTLIFRKQTSLNLDNGHISSKYFYCGLFEINKNE